MIIFEIKTSFGIQIKRKSYRFIARGNPINFESNWDNYELLSGGTLQSVNMETINAGLRELGVYGNKNDNNDADVKDVKFQRSSAPWRFFHFSKLKK